MSESPAAPRPEPAGAVLLMAVWLGLLSGLVEGAGWMIIQRFDRLTNLWTQVVWIAPVVNAITFLVVGLLLVPGLRLLPERWRAQAGTFALASLAAGHFVALTFYGYLHIAVLPIVTLGLASALTRWFRRDSAATLRVMRRTLPILAATTVALLVGVQSWYALRERSQLRALPVAADDAPDVLLVIIDALRADHVSAYGYPRPTSPFIDEVARDGVLFERTAAASPYSLPSHASLLSGLDPYQHGVEWMQFKVFRDAPYPSIAERLRDLGYRTGAFSSNPFWFTREQGFGRGFLRFEDFYHSWQDMAFRTVFGKVVERIRPQFGFEGIPARKEATEGVDRVLDWVTRDSTRPFFAMVNLFDVHDPYTPPQPYRSRFSTEEAPGGILNWRIGRDLITLTPEERETEIAAYDGALAYVDAELRRLDEALRARRPGRGHLLILTSDHGEAFGEHGGYLHARSLYREEVMIPLVMKGPGIPAGVRIDRPVSHTAIPSTILELVGPADAAPLGLPSLAPLWRDPATRDQWEYPLAEVAQRDWAGPTFKVNFGDIRTLLSPDWQYIAYDSLPHELFGWRDTLQVDDRSGDPSLAEVIRDFRARLAARPRPAP